jgi:hypothetical protein
MGSFQARKPLFGKEGREPALWHQAGTLASFVPRVEGRQQPFRPLQRFDLRPRVADLSGGFSPRGHFHRSVVRRHERHVSTSLHPFAPPALPGFFATMGALTPGRAALRLEGVVAGFELRPGLPVFCHRTVRSFRLQPPTVVPSRLWGFFASGLPDHAAVAVLFRTRASFGLRQSLAGSPRRSAESSSLALRTNRSPPVALHPASRRRSYLRLRSARTLRQGLAPC